MQYKKQKGKKMKKSSNNHSCLCTGMKHRCFTLIELLVVIAIIAILAGMLLPALNNARGSARKSNCANNQKELARYLSNYSDDNNDYMPCSVMKDGFYDSNEITPNWMTAVNRYYKLKDTRAKTGNLFSCPSDKHTHTIGFWGFSLSYGTNISGFIYVDSNEEKYLRYKTGSIRQPSNYVILMDTEKTANFNTGTTGPYYYGWGSTDSPMPETMLKHNGYINTAHADGHVSAMKLPTPKATSDMFKWFRTGVRYY